MNAQFYLQSGAILLGSFFFILYTIRSKSLTLSGAITATFFGFTVIFFSGAEWLIPLFYFFITGTFLGKLNKTDTYLTDNKHGKGRDAFQIICNGLPYVILTILVESYPIEALTLMSISIAIGVSDTWSSEIGMYLRGPTFDIIKLKKQPPGISGGISGVGSLSGFIGAVSTAFICIFLISHKADLFIIKEIEIFCLISLAGFGGMLLDSILGSLLQIKYKNPISGELSDTASAENVKFSGLSWMTNDIVNLTSNLTGTGIAAYYIF